MKSKMNIYFIFWDHDFYDENGKHLNTHSGQEGFWIKKPSNEEVAKYLIEQYPNLKEEINRGLNGNVGKTSVVWDIEEWEQID